MTNTPKNRNEVVELMAHRQFENSSFHPDDHGTPAVEEFWQEGRERAIAAMSKTLTALEAAGLRIVPAEATEEMNASAEKVYEGDNPYAFHPTFDIYDAMLAASPYNPQRSADNG